jgi:hypothetical protein
MGATRFMLSLRTGEQITGAIHGSGGLVASNDCRRIAKAIERAHEGRNTGLYEPQPGFVRVYTKATALEASEHIDVDLRLVRGVSIVGEVEAA